MNLQQTRSGSEKGVRQGRFAKWFSCALLLAAATPAQVKASFTGEYALSRFTLTNANADGSAALMAGSLILTGGNNGSDLIGMTDLTIKSKGTGEVHFNFLYSSLDQPGYDLAGYLLDGNFNRFADSDGHSGFISFPVLAGQTFGFRVSTLDNTFEPGVLTISDFNAPAVPEPATLTLMLTAMAAGLTVRRKANFTTGNKERQQ